MLKKWNLPIKSSDDDPELIIKCLTTGYFANAA